MARQPARAKAGKKAVPKSYDGTELGYQGLRAAAEIYYNDSLCRLAERNKPCQSLKT
jgi:hypothetical protein